MLLWEKTSKVLLFTVRHPVLSKILSYFSAEWKNTTYFVLPYFLIYPSLSTKIICKGFEPYGVLYATSQIKIFSYRFSSNKILSRLKPLILKMLSKKLTCHI